MSGMLLVVMGVACKPTKKPAKLKAPDYVLEESASAVASAETPQAVSGNRFEDYFAAFTLDRPNSDWEFLTSEKVGSLLPDATMGMVNQRMSAYVVVITETIKNSSLEKYSDLILAEDSTLGSGEGEVRKGKIGELDALFKETTIAMSGVNFHYDVALVRRGDFYYQILGWVFAEKYALAGNEITGVIQSFLPVVEREPELRAYLDTPDGVGFGWSLQGGVFSHAVFGFRMKTPEACRIMGLSELQNTSEEAIMGIAGGFGEYYQTLSVEKIQESGQMEDSAKLIAESLGGELGERRTVKTGGLDAVEAKVVLADNGDAGVNFEYRVTWFEREGRAFRFLSWWQADDSEAALVLLERSYASLEWLDAGEMAKARSAAVSADPGNSVGLDFALRQGVFLDFGQEFQLTLPKDQIFITNTAATKEGLEARMAFSNLDSGIDGELYTFGLEVEHTAYHEESMNGLDPQTVERKVAGLDFIESFYTSGTDELSYGNLYASVAKGSKCFELWLFGVGASKEDLDKELDQLAKGLEWPEGGLKKLEITKRDFVDNRLGYKLKIPKGWSAKEISMGNVASLGSGALLEKGKTLAMGITAICSPQGVDLDMAARSVFQQPGIIVDGASEKISVGELAGLACKRTSANATLGRTAVTINVWAVKKSETGYICYVIDGTKLSEAEIQDLKDSVSVF